MTELLREEAARLLYPGLFPDEAYRRHPGQIDRVRRLLADRQAVRELADEWRRYRVLPTDLADRLCAVAGEPL